MGLTCHPPLHMQWGMKATYAIVSDVTPNRCNLDKLVTIDGTALDVARQLDVGPHRIMTVPGGVLVAVGQRAWHRDDEIQGGS
jgi:hypothetical protein